MTRKDKLPSTWSAEDAKKGARQAEVWMKFFAGDTWVKRQSSSGARGADETSRVAAVRAAHEAALMRYPNVVGVSEGIEVKRGRPTGAPCITVYVTRKVPKANLSKSHTLPDRIEGVRVDVVEVGSVDALPT